MIGIYFIICSYYLLSVKILTLKQLWLNLFFIVLTSLLGERSSSDLFYYEKINNFYDEDMIILGFLLFYIFRP
jgi:hypothetical protein